MKSEDIGSQVSLDIERTICQLMVLRSLHYLYCNSVSETIKLQWFYYIILRNYG